MVLNKGISLESKQVALAIDKTIVVVVVIVSLAKAFLTDDYS